MAVSAERAVRGLGCLFNALEAAPSHWKRELKEKGCSPWPHPNDISSGMEEMLTEGPVCHHR